jgi:nitroimidazol reductase NimA-like FMN-containing flavoprotein (pyridoxamine 5'-phosphate oxidase superfamily)
MRRTDKEITEREAIDTIIVRSQICRLGLCDDGMAYIVPLCFGYDGKSLYFHCAREGRKIDILEKNNRVCFEFDIDTEVVRGDKACNFSMRYRSVMGEGRAHFVEEGPSKKRALESIMKQYGDDGSLGETDLSKITVFRVDIEHMSGKKSKL